MKIHFSHKEELGILVSCRWHSPRRGFRRDISDMVPAFRRRLGHGRCDTLPCGMLMSYVASTVYHALSARSVWKERLRKWDHAAIYWHIAGSYSPITLIAMRTQGYWGWTFFIFIWRAPSPAPISSFIHIKDHSNLETICFVVWASVCLSPSNPHRLRHHGHHHLDYRRGRVLHHGCRLLQSQQAQIHAHRVPFLLSLPAPSATSSPCGTSSWNTFKGGKVKGEGSKKKNPKLQFKTFLIAI